MRMLQFVVGLTSRILLSLPVSATKNWVSLLYNQFMIHCLLGCLTKMTEPKQKSSVRGFTVNFFTIGVWLIKVKMLLKNYSGTIFTDLCTILSHALIYPTLWWGLLLNIIITSSISIKPLLFLLDSIVILELQCLINLLATYHIGIRVLHHLFLGTTWPKVFSMFPLSKQKFYVILFVDLQSSQTT